MARNPKSIGDILPELLARRGVARIKSAANYEEAWRQAAGDLVAKYTRIGQPRGGKLEVVVANSTLVQELGFQREMLLGKLAQLLPDERIDQLRFRVGIVN